MEVSLDEAGEDAFLRLAQGLPAFADDLASVAKGLAELGRDLVVVPTAKSVGSTLSLNEALTDLTVLAPSLPSDERARAEKAAAQLRLFKAWRAPSPARTGADLEVPQDPNKKESVGVFLRVPPRLAAKFPAKAEDTSPVHATLLMVGDATYAEYQKVIGAVRTVLMGLDSPDVEVTDYGEFTSKKGQTIPHMIPRSRGISLEELHKKLRSQVESALGREVDHYEGPFKAHITLDFLDGDKRYEGPKPTGKFKAKSLEIWGSPGGEFGRSVVEFGSGDLLKHIEATKAAIANLEVPQDSAPVLNALIVKKAEVDDEEDERTVLGIVLEPETVDSQKDIYSAEAIKQSAWGWAERWQKFGLMHVEIIPGVRLLETYLAPVAFSIGDRRIKKGTWLLRVRVIDDAVWADVKSGKLTGFSIGGTANRQAEKQVA